jgi:hypothetical protein
VAGVGGEAIFEASPRKVESGLPRAPYVVFH